MFLFFNDSSCLEKAAMKTVTDMVPLLLTILLKVYHFHYFHFTLWLFSWLRQSKTCLQTHYSHLRKKWIFRWSQDWEQAFPSLSTLTTMKHFQWFDETPSQDFLSSVSHTIKIWKSFSSESSEEVKTQAMGLIQFLNKVLERLSRT